MPALMKAIQNVEVTTFLFPGAAWIADGHVDLFFGAPQGSTVMKGKQEYGPGVKQIDYDKPTRVPSLDLSKFRRRISLNGDRIILKMDIE
jgi:hypothetical protein